MMTTITALAMAVISAIVSKGIDFGIGFSSVLVVLCIVFEMADFEKSKQLKLLKTGLTPHAKIFTVMFFVFIALKMLSLV